MPDQIKNDFVSHHHKDDASVDGLADLLSVQGIINKEQLDTGKGEKSTTP